MDNESTHSPELGRVETFEDWFEHAPRYDASDATNYNASPPSMVEVGGTISSGGRSKKSSMEEAPAAVAPSTTLPNAATSTSSMMRGVEQVCATSVQPVFNRVQPGS